MWNGTPKRIHRKNDRRGPSIVSRTMVAKTTINKDSIEIDLRIPVPFSAHDTWKFKCQFNLTPGHITGNSTPELELVRGIVRRTGGRREIVRVRTTTAAIEQPGETASTVPSNNGDNEASPQELETTPLNGNDLKQTIICDEPEAAEQEQEQRMINNEIMQPCNFEQDDEDDEDVTTEEEDTEMYCGF